MLIDKTIDLGNWSLFLIASMRDVPWVFHEPLTNDCQTNPWQALMEDCVLGIVSEVLSNTKSRSCSR
jgi:hypothetical protein